MSSIFNVFRDATTAFRDVTLTEGERKKREATKGYLEIARVALVVTAAVSVLFAVAFPKVATFAIASVICFWAYEMFQVANNGLEILNNATVEVVARLSGENGANQIFKNTIVIGSIFKIIKNIDR